MSTTNGNGARICYRCEQHPARAGGPLCDPCLAADQRERTRASVAAVRRRRWALIAEQAAQSPD